MAVQLAVKAKTRHSYSLKMTQVVARRKRRS